MYYFHKLDLEIQSMTFNKYFLATGKTGKVSPKAPE